MSAKCKVALTMIVRDESHVIGRVLDIMLPFCDSWCIVDTGSLDDTKEKILARCKDLPGKLHERPWPNHFGKARTMALELAYDIADWAFVCDADDYCEGGPLPPLDFQFAAYHVHLREGDMQHRRLQLFNLRDYDWWYQQAVHELPRCRGDRKSLAEKKEQEKNEKQEHKDTKKKNKAQDDKANDKGNDKAKPNDKKEVGTSAPSHVDVPLGSIPWPFVMIARREGARSRDARKYARDAEMLNADLDNPESCYERTVFYLAQSYKDARDYAKAKKWYAKSVASDKTWSEERYIACLNLVRLSEDFEDKLKWVWKAQSFSRERKEAVYEILKFSRERDLWREELYALGFTYKAAKPKDEWLFVELEAYGWRFWDELAIHAFYTGGRYREAEMFTNFALNQTPILASGPGSALLAIAPENERTRLRDNLDKHILPRLKS